MKMHLQDTIEIITARVRSTREGTVFTGVCLFTFRGGGVPHPADVGGGGGGVSHPRSRWGVPHPADGGGVPRPWSRGVPHPRSGWGRGTSSQVWMETPPPSRTRWDTPPPPPVRRQSSIANTCYAAGGMPLAFTQKDFLVTDKFIVKRLLTHTNPSAYADGTEDRRCVQWDKTSCIHYFHQF